MKSKICTKCKSSLTINQFHKDKQNRDGYSSACGECRNKHKRKPAKAKHFFNGKPKEKKPKEDINDMLAKHFSNIFEKLSVKYGSHYNISISKVGKCVLTTHGNPSHSWLGKNWNVEELVSSAL